MDEDTDVATAGRIVSIVERREQARTPPMGWNSWDCFGSSVTEAEVVANAEFMAAHLLPHGWDTIVVDIQWYEPDPGLTDYQTVSDPVLDAWGRQLPAPNRFPSAAGGSFRPLADRIHALGLRFGLHMMRGIPRKAVERAVRVLGTDVTAADIADRSSVCPWNPDNYGIDHSRPGAQGYYDSQVAQFAEWGVDFIKLDDVLYPPIERAEIEAYSRAIDRSGRPMILSLSPGRQLSTAYLDTLRATAQMWRISDDLWDEWSQVLEQFQRAARWAPHQIPGAWADADMLPLGRLGIRAHVGDDRMSRLTLDEQRTLISLWCMVRSPLMFGGHLPDTPAETLALLTNDALLDVLARSTGGREIIRDHSLVVWGADLDGDAVRTVFWLGGEDAVLDVHLADLGCGEPADAVDLWSGAGVAIADGALHLELPSHGARVIRLTRAAAPEYL